MPISTNALYANVPGKGRVKTKKYRAWIKAADAAYLIQKRVQKPVLDNFIAHIILDDGKRAGDIDNRAKAVLDRLVSWGLIIDDRHCNLITIEWGKRVTINWDKIHVDVEHVPSDCRVYVWPAEGEPMQ